MIQSYRLSPQQERVWLLQDHDSLQPYRAQCSLLLEGRLDEIRLQAAIETVVARHEILRTTFQNLADVAIPVQIISEATSIVLQKYDLTEFTAAEQQERLAALLRETRERPCDFAHGPLLDCVLVKLSPERHVLIIGIPALCADIKGLQNLAREIRQGYDNKDQLDGEPMQYADYAAWR